MSLAQMQVVRTGARPDSSIPQILECRAKSQLNFQLSLTGLDWTGSGTQDFILG